MSGNPYRRQGGPPLQNGQQGGMNNGSGYYNRMSNSQYHHNLHNNHNNHNNHNFNNHNNHNNHNHHNYNRHMNYNRNHYNHGYSNQYDSRHNSYHSQHPNSRYHPQHSQYSSNTINNNVSNKISNNMSLPRRSFSSSGANNTPLTSSQSHSQSQSQQHNISISSNASPATINTNETTIKNNIHEETSTNKDKPSLVKNAQLLSSRRSEETQPVSSSLPSHSLQRSNLHATSNESNISVKYEDKLKGKPLDINSLQPMKKKKLVPSKTENDYKAIEKGEHKKDLVKEDKSKVEGVGIKEDKRDEENSKENEMKEDNLKDDSLKNNNLKDNKLNDEHMTNDSNDTSSDIKSKTIKNIENVERETISDLDQISEGKNEKLDNGSNAIIFENKKSVLDTEKGIEDKKERKDSIHNDNSTREKDSTDNNQIISDEDEPIHAKSRNVSADVSTPSVIQESEEETDIEDTIPVPSKKTRRLHRILKTSELNEDEEEALSKNMTENKSNKLVVAKKNSNGSSSTSRSSRSQSPKQRKTSRVGRDASGRTLLQRMCAKGNYDEVKRLIDEGQNINDADFAGITPLHEAALEGYYEIAELLLDNGAEINVQSGQMDKDTPLIDAVSNLHYKVVQLLLKRGANPTIENAQGDNALDSLENAIKEYDAHADEDGEILNNSKRIRKILNQYIKNFESTSNSKGYAIKSKRKHERSNSDMLDDDQHSYAILRKGGSNSLQERISANDVTFVLNYVSSMNGKKIPAESLLLASKLGFPDIASLLIAFGANINFKDKNGLTPLILAVGKGHLEMVKLLLSNQADVTLKDNRGRNALDVLREKGLTDSEEYKLIYAKTKQIQSLNDDKMDVDDDKKYHSKEDNTKKIDKDEQETLEEKTAVDEALDLNMDKKKNISKKRKLSMGEVDDIKVQDIDNEATEEDHHINKKTKNSEKTSSSPSPSPSVKRTLTIKKKKHNEDIEEKRSTEPTPEELEAQKQKELEAQKAREALEHQRLERKKLKQQEIAKRIDAFEKQREEEKKALERENLEKKRKEEEEHNKLLLKEEENRKKEELKHTIERKKLIRSYYPFGLRNAVFNKKLTEEEIEKYLPVYIFTINDEKYIIDLQINLILGVEDLYHQFPQLYKKKIRFEEKKKIWNFLWPLIGSFSNGDISIDRLQKVYKIEGENFNELIINWVKLDDFKKLVKDNEEWDVVEKCLEQNGYCQASISNNDTPTSETIYDNSKKDIIKLDETSSKISNNDIPLKFGRRTKIALKMMNKPLW